MTDYITTFFSVAGLFLGFTMPLWAELIFQALFQ